MLPGVIAAMSRIQMSFLATMLLIAAFELMPVVQALADGSSP
jgi:hypothetical protein